MNLLTRFKKDYLNYLLSIILPALVSGVSIPLFKHLLGAKGYGEFSIYYNAILIGSAVTTGWITQSIYRFYPMIKNKILFTKFSIALSNKTQLLFFLPVIFFIWYTKNDFLLGVLICLTIFMNSMQFSYIAITQSSFLSKKTIYSESIRTTSYMIIASVFLLVTPSHYLYVLFIANIVSFILSVFYLHRQTEFFFIQNNSNNEDLEHDKLTKQFLTYGVPLSLWVVFSYLIPYIDKILILRNLGAQMQGNYQAIFDLLSRGFTVLISPVIISLYPLLTHAYEKSEIFQIRQLMKKIILLEIAGLFISGILYWWFGSDVLFIILKIPNTISYRIMGFIILAGTFVWQIAMVMHQKYVLKLKSRNLLYMISIAFSVQIFFYWLSRKSDNPIIYPLGYLIAASTYLFFVSISQLSLILNSFFLSVKSYFSK